jgi:hypothetical protein
MAIVNHLQAIPFPAADVPEELCFKKNQGGIAVTAVLVRRLIRPRTHVAWTDRLEHLLATLTWPPICLRARDIGDSRHSSVRASADAGLVLTPQAV